VLFAPCLTGTCAGGGEKKLYFLEKKPGKYFVSSRNCRTFALAFGKFSGAGLRKGVFRGPLEEVIFDILQTTTRQQSAFPAGGGADSKARYVDSFTNRIQWIPIERICLGQNTDSFNQVSMPSTPYYIYNMGG